MDIWRIFQLIACAFAVLATVLTVAAFYFPTVAYWAMWVWCFTLWTFMFVVPMPIIERNKKSNQVALALSFLLSVMLAVTVNTWLQDNYPATHGFSRGMLVYSASYTILALLLATWLKLKEKKNK